jgi:hypothetical protein
VLLPALLAVVQLLSCNCKLPAYCVHTLPCDLYVQQLSLHKAGTIVANSAVTLPGQGQLDSNMFMLAVYWLSAFYADLNRCQHNGSAVV